MHFISRTQSEVWNILSYTCDIAQYTRTPRNVFRVLQSGQDRCGTASLFRLAGDSRAPRNILRFYSKKKFPRARISLTPRISRISLTPLHTTRRNEEYQTFFFLVPLSALPNSGISLIRLSAIQDFLRVTRNSEFLSRLARPGKTRGARLLRAYPRAREKERVFNLLSNTP